MHDVVRRLLPIAANPPQLPLCQSIQEAEAEIAQIEEQQTPFRESSQEVEYIYSAVFMYRLAPFQPQPSLGAQIQQAYQFARKAGRVVRAQGAQGLQIPSHRIESGFIQTEDISSKGGEC